MAEVSAYLKRVEQKLRTKRVPRKRRIAPMPLEPGPVHKLPDEVLLLIFQQLPGPLLAASVCRVWRNVATNVTLLWRRAMLRPGLSAKQCIEALNCFSHRSYETIENVEMPESILQCDPSVILSILQKSAPTLRHIKMASLYQQTCYEELYRHCDNLQYLDIEIQTQVRFLEDVPDDYLEALPLYGSEQIPFRLTVYRAGCLYRVPVAIMHNLTVLRCYGLELYGTDPMKSFRALVGMADTLEELAIVDNEEIEERLATYGDWEAGTEAQLQPITFKKLKTLDGWYPRANFKKFEFPLLETAINIFYYELPPGSEEFWSASMFFASSPLIRRLDVYISDSPGIDELIAAITHLKCLEELSLMDDGGEGDVQHLERIFAPRFFYGTDLRPYMQEMPCPRLKRLSLSHRNVSAKALLQVVFLRHYLSLGLTFKAAVQQVPEEFRWPHTADLDIPSSFENIQFYVVGLEILLLERMVMDREIYDRFQQLAGTVSISLYPHGRQATNF